MENCAIIIVDRPLGNKSRNVPALNWMKEPPKPFIDRGGRGCRWFIMPLCHERPPSQCDSSHYLLIGRVVVARFFVKHFRLRW